MIDTKQIEKLKTGASKEFADKQENCYNCNRKMKKQRKYIHGIWVYIWICTDCEAELL